MVDDLSAPLGQGKKRRRFRVPFAAPAAITGLLSVCLAVFVFWAAVVDDPMGGEPVVVIATPDLQSSANAATRDDGRAAAGSADRPAGERAGAVHETGTPAGDMQTVTIIDGSSGKAQEVQVPAAEGGRSKAADARLLENSRHGQIPRIGIDGARPLTAYANAAAVPAAKAELPKVAIIVGGLGISAGSTAEAMAKLPAAVTFAFAPYGGDVARLGSRARAEGHEVLLQLPMEPFDYPDNDPGPQTLLTNLSPEQNVDRMHWLMSRLQGYVGVANYMGARFTATEASLMPILRETAKRGLLYVDDGSSPRSLAGQIAGANNLPFAKADVILDTVPTPAEIERAMRRLEARAREVGSAVGMASALPVSIDRLTQWAKTAEQRGFLLVPITAVAVKSKSAI